MARIASKLNWTSDPDNAPLPSDFNRIENNNQQAFDELDAEVIRATADVDEEEAARIADVNEEEARATDAEENITDVILGGVNLSTGNAGTYGFVNLSSGSTWVIPAGTYMMGGAGEYNASVSLNIYTGSEWRGINPVGGIVISDGVNFRIQARGEPGTVYYRKLA
jgi:hypothetical protein